MVPGGSLRYTCADESLSTWNHMSSGKPYFSRSSFSNLSLPMYTTYGFPEDIWFHVDKLSSAHVYLRLPPGTIDLSGVKDKAVAKQKLMDAIKEVPEDILQEMAVLTKANSIDGCKQSEVDIVYTPYLNLKKEERMDTGQVGFKDESVRILMRNVARDKEIEKRLEKTRVERKVDFVKEKEQRDAEERARRRKFLEEERKKEKEEEEKHREEKELKEYTALQHLDKGETNAAASKTGTVEECRELEEDFM